MFQPSVSQSSSGESVSQSASQLLSQSHIFLSDLSLLVMFVMFVEYMTLVIYSLVYPFVVVCYVFMSRKVAMTLKLNNSSSIVQIHIKLYIFGILGVF